MNNSKPENPWLNILFNVIIPVAIFNKSTKYFPELDELFKLGIALSFPLAYGFWDFWQRKKWNMMSIIGIISVLLTGGFAVFHLTGFWFVVKEAAMPLLFGIVVLASAFTEKPFLKILFFNDSVLNVALIEKKIQENGAVEEFRKHLKNSTFLLAGSFFVSAILNYVLAVIIFTDIDQTILPELQTKILNEQIAQMTWVSYIVIVVPSLICMGLMFWHLFSGIKKMTGLAMEDVMHNAKKTKSDSSTDTLDNDISRGSANE